MTTTTGSGAAERIDAFGHALTKPFMEEVATNYDVPGLTGPYDWLWDVERYKADLADFGIDRQVITLALPRLWRALDADEALSLVEVANDEIRRLADEHPDTFIPVGTVPFPDDQYRDEFDRCLDELGMAGVQVFTNVDGRPVDRQEFHWWYEYAERHGCPLWLHPQLTAWYDWTDDRLDHRVFGWPFDTTLALSRLVFAGLTQAYDFDLVTHHGGGMVPFFGARIDMFYGGGAAPPGVDDAVFRRFEGRPSDAFRGFTADTALDGSTAALACTHEFFGPDRVVFGTDYPFGPDRGRAKLEAIVGSVEAADLGDDQRAAVFGGNLQSLL